MSPTTEIAVDTIKIQIDTHTQEYYIWKTSAPQAYYGFGTFTVQESGKERWVLVPVEHADWQEGRYCSGRYSPEKRDQLDKMIRKHVVNVIWKRMAGVPNE